ncbi:DNA-directed RNA polymerase III subunit RPC7 isoform X1 [Rissa tridactyla]|uniref:DNA-directed RNA polymerase III subunit RPC7 isoform X1 n=1 Tax=Rissa tridactyla TaxID=75485 RepID=UPI0023BAB68D|nr:DNA-directed RNA polymerase III subunit RPC7 isoform X1 [Rissa tridactyla]
MPMMGIDVMTEVQQYVWNGHLLTNNLKWLGQVEEEDGLRLPSTLRLLALLKVQLCLMSCVSLHHHFLTVKNGAALCSVSSEHTANQMLWLTKGRKFPLTCSWSPAVTRRQQAAVVQQEHGPGWTLTVRPAIERYSQKYQDIEKEHAAWTPVIFCTDWRRLPREMKPKKKTKKAFFCRIVNQILQQQLELVLVVLTGKEFFITQHHTCVCFSKCFLQVQNQKRQKALSLKVIWMC